MKTVRVTVLQDHDYDEKPRKVGDSYEADPKFLSLLTGLGRVKVAAGESEAPKNQYKRRDMRPEK